LLLNKQIRRTNKKKLCKKPLTESQRRQENQFALTKNSLPIFLINIECAVSIYKQKKETFENHHSQLQRKRTVLLFSKKKPKWAQNNTKNNENINVPAGQGDELNCRTTFYHLF